ncbi:MAG TPA: PEP-CTERM sorting domain-containing protein [Candidatus Deferrimicrobiaceae bacterium]|jgi:hypothetical protein
MKGTRRTTLTVLSALLLCLLSAGAAQANAIVYTGPVIAESAGGTRLPDWTLNYSQWLGSEFTINGPTTITGVQGFFDCSNAGKLLAVLHANVGMIPGDTLFSQEFSVKAGSGTVTSRNGYNYDWFGADGFAWDVGPGSYWLTFEAPDSSYYDGHMLGEAQNPLEKDAHYDWTAKTWIPGPDYEELRLGIRIEGESGTKPSAVPEPGTMMLLGSGFVALAGLGRSRFAVKN